MYDNHHRMFLQVLTEHGALLEANAKEFIMHIFGTNKSITSIMCEINSELNVINMMIQSSVCEVTGEKYWMLTSLVKGDVEKFQTIFLPHQLDFLKNIFTKIIASECGYVSSTQCLNLISKLRRMTIEDGESFLNSMIKNKWLCTKDGKYYIGPRSAVELLSYFKGTCGNTLLNCLLCRQVVFYGKKCRHCLKKMHYTCLRNISSTEESKCPGCDELISISSQEFDKNHHNQTEMDCSDE